jgi:hypothetical protein
VAALTTRRQREVAAEHFACDILGAVRTRRAQRGRFQDEELMGADVWARLPGGIHALVQETKAATRMADKRRGLERLGGDEFVPLRESERRIVLLWHTVPHPSDGRKQIHRFDVHELASTWLDDVDEDAGTASNHQRLGHARLTFDGRSRRPDLAHVWGRWPEPIEIFRPTWYRTDNL